jgi:hypothetical protein
MLRNILITTALALPFAFGGATQAHRWSGKLHHRRTAHKNGFNDRRTGWWDVGLEEAARVFIVPSLIYRNVESRIRLKRG